MNELSTELKKQELEGTLRTYEVHIKKDGIIERHLITEKEKDQIWDDAYNKRPFQIPGVGGFKTFQFENILPLTHEAILKHHSLRWIFKDRKVVFENFQEKEIETWAQYNPQTRTEIKTEQRIKVVKRWTEEEYNLQKKKAQAIRDGIKEGMTLPEIFEQFKKENTIPPNDDNGKEVDLGVSNGVEPRS